MKAEYLLKLFNHFNKQIWTNKIFSYFLIAIIIGYTIALRPHPDIYYKYVYNPLILIILIFSIILITKYNTPLGFMLTFSLLALYFPKHPSSQIVEEGFESVKTPVYGEDKNIVDDEKKTKNTKPTPTKKSEEEEEAEEEVEEEDKKAKVNDKKANDKKNKEDDDEDEVKEIGLEKLNPGYYKNKSKNSEKNNKISTKTTEKPRKEEYKNSSKDSETFLGDVRQVIKDLDTGRGGMNASGAIKTINNLFYNKHKTNIKQIIEQADDSEEEDDDEDFF